jgi:uncharacterized cupredoxin-like copper-binding protein
MRTRNLIALSALAIVVLAAASTLAVFAARRGFDTGNGGYGNAGRSTCTVPNLPGTVVNVSLTNMGGPMMGGPGMGGSVRGGMMRLTADATSVAHGSVSFVATNLGSTDHELVVLSLPNNQIVGTRPLRDDSTVDETASIGEASNTCGSGTGDGIAPGASSWTTVTVAPGRYELVCNLPGHYAAGMYTQLTVD